MISQIYLRHFGATNRIFLQKACRYNLSVIRQSKDQAQNGKDDTNNSSKLKLLHNKPLVEISTNYTSYYDQHVKVWQTALKIQNSSYLTENKDYIEQLKTIESQKTFDLSKQIKTYLDNVYSSENVFNLHLDIFTISIENKQDKKKLIEYFDDLFVKWSETIPERDKNGERLLNGYLTDHVKIRAFDLMLKSNDLHIFYRLNRVYQFAQSLNLYHDILKTFMKQSSNNEFKFKLIKELKLEEHKESIDYEKIVIRRILTQNISEIKELVRNDPIKKILFTNVCNELTQDDQKLKYLVERYNSKLVKGHITFDREKVEKFRRRCEKSWNKTKDNAEEIKENQEFSAEKIHDMRLKQLKTLLYLKYKDSMGLNMTTFSELIQDTIDGNEKLIENLFNLLTNDHLSLYHFTKVYSKKYIKLLPEATQKEFNEKIDQLKNRQEKIMQKEKDELQSDKYYKPIELTSKDSIIFVNSTKKFADMLNYLKLNQPDVIGLDCEWKPQLNKELTSMLYKSIIHKRPNTFQVATRQRVFVIEVKHLVDKLDDKLVEIDQTATMKFNTFKGYQLESDLKMIVNSFPKYSDKLFSMNFYNIDDIVKKFEYDWPLTKDGITQFQSRGLSKLTERCFGKPLNKTECVSNWENNPLRPSQLQYAALDAFVLIKVYEFLHERCKELNVKFTYNGRNSKLKSLIFN